MKISPTGKGSVQYGAKKYAQMDNTTDYGPPPGSAAPVSPQNPNSKSLKRLTGCTVTLNGSMLDISNAEYSIALNLQPDQVEQMVQELSGSSGGQEKWVPGIGHVFTNND